MGEVPPYGKAFSDFRDLVVLMRTHFGEKP